MKTSVSSYVDSLICVRTVTFTKKKTLFWATVSHWLTGSGRSSPFSLYEIIFSWTDCKYCTEAQQLPELNFPAQTVSAVPQTQQLPELNFPAQTVNTVPQTQQLPELNSATLKIFSTGWTVRGSNTGGGEIFRTHAHWSWGPPSLPYNGYRVIPWCKAVEARL